MSGISARGQTLGLSSDRYTAEWNAAEDKVLRDEYRKGTRIVDIAAKLTDHGPGRSRQSVQMRAIHLGITVDRVNYWSEKETAIALDGMRADKPSSAIIADLKAAGFHRGVTALYKFRQKHGFRKPHAPWTPAEHAVLRERYAQRRPAREIAAELGKTPASVRTEASRLGIKQRIPWTAEERAMLRDAVKKHGSVKKAADAIGRPYTNVYGEARRMGLAGK